MNFREFLKRIMVHGLERIGLFYGEYEGEVVEVDNRMRIRAKCHALWPDNLDAPDIWAWPALGPVHPGGGMWWPPSVGDPVRIKCRFGRPDHPVWGPGWWRDADLPADIDETNGKTKRFIRTPAGWTIEIAETLGIDRLKIYRPD